MNWLDRIGKNQIIALAIIGAIIVAASGNDGWGWLIFLAAALIL